MEVKGSNPLTVGLLQTMNRLEEASSNCSLWIVNFLNLICFSIGLFYSFFKLSIYPGYIQLVFTNIPALAYSIQSIYIYIYIHIHTYNTYTNIHTHIHTYIHTYFFFFKFLYFTRHKISNTILVCVLHLDSIEMPMVVDIRTWVRNTFCKSNIICAISSQYKATIITRNFV